MLGAALNSHWSNNYTLFKRLSDKLRMNQGILLILGLVALSGVYASMSPNPGGCYCPDKHPQQKFCDDSLVIRGTIRGMWSAEATGWDQGMNMDMTVEVLVSEVFKTKEQIGPGSTIHLHTYGMCRFQKMMKAGQEFVLSATDAYQPGYYIIMRGCNWVQKWGTLTREQRNGLRGDYHYCGVCEITKTMASNTMFDNYSFLEPSPLGEGERRLGYCFHNQQMSMTMDSYVDCETMHSACLPRQDSCEWAETKVFKKCVKQRAKENQKVWRKSKKSEGRKGPKGGKPKRGKAKRLPRGG